MDQYDGKIHFSASEIFTESKLNFGNMDIIERTINKLAEDGYIELTGYIGYSFKLL